MKKSPDTVTDWDLMKGLNWVNGWNFKIFRGNIVWVLQGISRKEI